MKLNLIYNLYSQTDKKKENAAKLGVALAASTILTAGIWMLLYLFGITILGVVGRAAVLALIHYESTKKSNTDPNIICSLSKTMAAVGWANIISYASILC